MVEFVPPFRVTKEAIEWCSQQQYVDTFQPFWLIGFVPLILLIPIIIHHSREKILADVEGATPELLDKLYIGGLYFAFYLSVAFMIYFFTST